MVAINAAQHLNVMVKAIATVQDAIFAGNLIVI